MVVDASGNISVKFLGNAFAAIDYMKILDAGTSTWYDIFPNPTFPDGHANVTVGAQCWITVRLRNSGNLTGNVYLKVTRTDTGAVIFNQSYNLMPNQYYDISNPAPNFTMPANDVALTFEIGH